MRHKCYKSGKEMFLTRAPAEMALRRLSMKSHSNMGSVYLCQYCHTYHITHWGYEVQDIFNRYEPEQLPKKLLRSRRKKPLFQTTPNKENDMTRKITPLIPNTNGRLLNAQLSAAAGELKMFLGGQNNAAILTLEYAMDLLEGECPQYRTTIKGEFQKAIRELNRYKHGLLNPAPGQMRMFHMADFAPVDRHQYKKDMTDEEYLEFWQSTGGELYAKTIPFMKSLAWKFQRHFERVGHKGCKALAWVVVTDNLLALAVETYDKVCEQCTKHLSSPVKPGLEIIFDVLSLRRVSQAWHRATNLLTASRTPLTDLEKEDFKAAMSVISEMWTDPTIYFDNANSAMDAYAEDIFDSKKQHKEARKSTNKIKHEIAEEIEKIKRENILKKA